MINIKIKNIINNIVIDILRCPKNLINNINVTFSELGADSLDILEIILLTENKLKINLIKKNIKYVQTLKNLYWLFEI